MHSRANPLAIWAGADRSSLISDVISGSVLAALIVLLAFDIVLVELSAGWPLGAFMAPQCCMYVNLPLHAPADGLPIFCGRRSDVRTSNSNLDVRKIQIFKDALADSNSQVWICIENVFPMALAISEGDCLNDCLHQGSEVNGALFVISDWLLQKQGIFTLAWIPLDWPKLLQMDRRGLKVRQKPIKE